MPSPSPHANLEETAAYAAEQDSEVSREAARFAHRILDEIIAHIKPGMRESEVKKFAHERFAHYELEKPWHSVYVRFGENTLFAYYNKEKEDRVLGENDIAFVDIGTTKNKIEGDAGRTVAFGNNPVHHELVAASRKIFDEALDYWRKNDPTGQEFYVKVEEITKAHGYVFNLKGPGHLIGRYPHRGWLHGLSNFPQKAVPGVWILEVQIRHPTLPYGAFFEDILY